MCGPCADMGVFPSGGGQIPNEYLHQQGSLLALFTDPDASACGLFFHCSQSWGWKEVLSYSERKEYNNFNRKGSHLFPGGRENTALLCLTVEPCGPAWEGPICPRCMWLLCIHGWKKDSRPLSCCYGNFFRVLATPFPGLLEQWRILSTEHEPSSEAF